MRQLTLGRTGIETPQNAFGALPIQRVSKEAAVRILRRAYDGGMTYFDTARAYSDSEEKLGAAFDGMRSRIFIATKTQAKTAEQFWEDLETSLEKLRTDYIDVYQFHMAGRVYAPGDGSGLYECMLKAKEQGRIRHIGITAHKIQVAMDAASSGLYETLQFPFSYLSSDKEIALVRLCREKGVGFVAMKGLAGGLITRSDAAMAFMSQFENVLPIWGIQRERELEEFLAYMDRTPAMNAELAALIRREQEELAGDFCRGCGYCMPCPAGIEINNCARMSLMLRRAPSAAWLTEAWQKKMEKINDCIGCNSCMQKCPYKLNTPELLKKNYADYRQVLRGEVSVL